MLAHISPNKYILVGSNDGILHVFFKKTIAIEIEESEFVCALCGNFNESMMVFWLGVRYFWYLIMWRALLQCD